MISWAIMFQPKDPQKIRASMITQSKQKSHKQTHTKVAHKTRVLRLSEIRWSRRTSHQQELGFRFDTHEPLSLWRWLDLDMDGWYMCNWHECMQMNLKPEVRWKNKNGGKILGYYTSARLPTLKTLSTHQTIFSPSRDRKPFQKDIF